jgi:CHAD domain-containing protein/CYTH domain-containing protein
MPAALAARLLCREYGAQAASAAESVFLPGERGIEARHDFRVALRRLRVTLLAYRDVLADCRPQKLARRAGALSRRVGVTRTRDIHRELMAAVLAARTAPQRAALEAYELSKADDSSDADDVVAFQRRWRRFEERLYTGIERWQVEHQLSGQQLAPPFSSEAAAALERATGVLERKCLAITEPEDLAGQHAARLAIKAIRYLLAPLADDDAGMRQLRGALREAQDLLGGITDAGSLRAHLRTTTTHAPTVDGRAQRTSVAALAAADRDLTQRMTQRFESLASWRKGAALSETVAVLRSVAESWRRGAAPPMEYERKWLLSGLPPDVRRVAPARLAQGYLPGDVLIERIRRVTTGRVTRWFRTVKLGRGVARIEVEEQTSPTVGKALFALTRGARVTKRRYAITDGALVWEVDEFTDRELVLLEVELPDAFATVELPAWLTPWVVREVTDDVAFTNWKLAR